MSRTFLSRRARYGAAAFVVASVLATTACASSSASTSEEPDTSTVIVSQPVDVVTLDPQMGTGEMTDMNVLVNVFDFLTAIDDEGVVQPALATSWETVGDTTWRFHLRDDVTFHNGEPFNADAVKFSFDRLEDPELKSPLATGGYLSSVDVVDEYTVDITTIIPSPYLPVQLSLFMGAILPPEYVSENEPAYVAENPVGTGAFSFVSWKRGDRVVLEANEDYWGGAPGIEELVFRAIPSPADAIAAMRAGEIDVIGGMEPDAAAQFEGSSEAEIRSIPGVRTFMLSLDTDNGGPLEDVRVRQALNYAVDADTIIETLRGGYATRTATTMPYQSQGFDESVTPYEYDPEKAKELLAEAGYPDGFSTTLSAVGDATMPQAVIAQLAEVGVDVELEMLDPGTFEQELISPDAGKLAPIFVLANTPWTLTPWSAFYGFVPSIHGMSRFTNDEADAYWATIDSSFDPAAQEEASFGMQQVLKDEAAFVSLYQIDNIYAVDPELEWEPNTIGLLRMQNASF